MNLKKATWLPWTLCAIITVVALVGGSRELARHVSEYDLLQWVVGVSWVLFPIVYAAMGALIVSRQPHNAIGWLLIIPAAMMALDGPIQSNLLTFSVVPPNPPLSYLLLTWYYGWSWLLLIIPFFLVSLLFPTGRPPTRRWRWVIVLAAGIFATFIAIGTLAASWETPDGAKFPSPIGFVPDQVMQALFLVWAAALIVFILLCVTSLFVRFRRAGGVEREQIKWLLYAFGFFLAIYIPQLLLPEDSAGWLASNAFGLLLIFGLMLMPLTIAAAILRYRLWDIDVIIRKTLLYGVLTALLALVYFGSIALLQGVVTAVSGQSSSVVIVLSTLVIAALFAPLRRRIQDVIDRRFYRRKYDAEQVLAHFAQTARDETDLDSLTAELARVVQETMQPEQVSVWLRKL